MKLAFKFSVDVNIEIGLYMIGPTKTPNLVPININNQANKGAKIKLGKYLLSFALSNKFSLDKNIITTSYYHYFHIKL